MAHRSECKHVYLFSDCLLSCCTKLPSRRTFHTTVPCVVRFFMAVASKNKSVLSLYYPVHWLWKSRKTRQRLNWRVSTHSKRSVVYWGCCMSHIFLKCLQGHSTLRLVFHSNLDCGREGHINITKQQLCGQSRPLQQLWQLFPDDLNLPVIARESSCWKILVFRGVWFTDLKKGCQTVQYCVFLRWGKFKHCWRK